MSEPLVCQAEVAKASQSPRNGRAFRSVARSKAGSLLIVNADSVPRGRVCRRLRDVGRSARRSRFRAWRARNRRIRRLITSRKRRVGSRASCRARCSASCARMSLCRWRAVKPKSIGVSLRKVATIGPSEFTNWSAIASQGAAAAEQGDTTALRSACNACHQAYRAAYRAKYRAHADWQEATTSFFEVAAGLGRRSDRMRSSAYQLPAGSRINVSSAPERRRQR